MPFNLHSIQRLTVVIAGRTLCVFSADCAGQSGLLRAMEKVKMTSKERALGSGAYLALRTSGKPARDGKRATPDQTRYWLVDLGRLPKIQPVRLTELQQAALVAEAITAISLDAFPGRGISISHPSQEG